MPQSSIGAARSKGRRRDILHPLLSKHYGRFVKVMGDGILAEFASAVNAVSCAVELQQSTTEAAAGDLEDRKMRGRRCNGR
jgi:class 3 adenylate cyclase